MGFLIDTDIWIAVETDNVATVLHQAIAQKLGRLADLTEIDRALRATLNL